MLHAVKVDAVHLWIVPPALERSVGRVASTTAMTTPAYAQLMLASRAAIAIRERGMRAVCC